MANEYAIPSTLDTFALNTSLADYQKQLVDNVYNAVTVFKLANQAGTKRTINGGMSIVETLIKEKQDTGGFYLGADVLNNTQLNTLATCEFLWQNAYEPIQITRDEERQNSGDSHKIVDLIATKMKLSELAIQDRLDQALSQSVAEANNLYSLADVIDDGLLGTIDGSSSTFWQSTLTTSGSFAAQGLSDMATATYAVSSSSSVDLPTHYLTTQTIFRRFEQTRLPLERISNTMTANAGFTNLTFKGKPVIYGNYIDSGVLYGINMNYLNLNVDSATDLVTTPFIAPTNQTVKVAYILWRGNLTTNNRRRHFKLSSIS